MRKSRFSEGQIIAILREQEAGVATADICRKHGIRDARFDKWKARYGALEVFEAKGRRALEDENARLKRLLAEAMLDNAALKDLLLKKLITPAARREAALRLMAERDFSQRRACGLVSVVRKTARRVVAPDAPELRQLLGVLLEREGVRLNHKKLCRIYREEGLAVRRRRGRKCVNGTRDPMTVTLASNDRWPLDFASDCIDRGRRFGIPMAVDHFIRECLAAFAATSISVARLARELDAVIAWRRPPRLIVSDNRPSGDPRSGRGLGREEPRDGLPGRVTPGQPLRRAMALHRPR